MKKVIEYFVKYPIVGNSILLMIIVFGLFAFFSTRVTFFPQLPTNLISISAYYPGASPEEIEEGITTKIEDAIKGITGILRTTSVSRENFAQISVELETGADANVVIQDIQSAVNSISSFPAGMEKLNVFNVEPREFVINFAVYGNKSLRQLKKIARKIERDLLAKPEISKLKLSGFPAEEIQVGFREKDLLAYGITLDEAARAIASENVKITGGKIKGKRKEFLIRADNKKYYAKELKNLVIKSTKDGTIIRLRDVADVIEKWSEDPNRVYFNGKPAIQVELQKTNNEDLFKITEVVRNYINKFNKTHDDVKLGIIRDGSEVVKARIDILESNGIIGMLLVAIFLSLVLHPRISFWVSISIPLSFLGMIALGKIYGLTFNVISLLGMIVVVGILVDDGIVISENIYSHYEKGEKPLTAAINGTKEVAASVASGVFTTVIVFVTFFFLKGKLGDRAVDIGFVVIATLLISLVEAIFILPAHIAHSKALGKDDIKKHPFLQKAELITNKIRDKYYLPVLNFSIKHPLVALTFPIALLIITIGGVKGGVIKTTFFPQLEFNYLTVSLELPAGSRDTITDSLLTSFESKVWKLNDEYVKQYPKKPPLVKNIIRTIGPTTNKGSIHVTIAGSEERMWDNITVRRKLREKIGNIPYAEKLEISSTNYFGAPVSVALRGESLDKLREAAEIVKAGLNKIPEVKDIVDNDPPGLQEIHIKLNNKAFSLGLTTAYVINQVRNAFFGKEAQRILRGIDEVKIWVRFPEKERASVEQLTNLRIKVPGRGEIPLREIADITGSDGILEINHIDGQRIIRVDADVVSSKVSIPEINQRIKKEIIPAVEARFPDIDWNFEGESRDSAKTIKSIKLTVPPFLLLMFIIVVLTFRSFSQAALVYSIIPFAILGSVWGHFFQGYIFSLFSGFGAIALIGIVVNDSIVMITTYNNYLRDGMKLKDAVKEAGISRFRPVILTSLTTIFGLGPLIFETSFQAQFLSPMAISVAYGLLVGTILTLIMVPSSLVLLNSVRYKIKKLIGTAPETVEEIEPPVIEQKRLKEYD